MAPRDHAAGETIPVALRDGCQLCRLTLATAGKMRVRKGRIVGLSNIVLKAWLALLLVSGLACFFERTYTCIWGGLMSSDLV